MATDLGKNVVVADQLEALSIAVKNYVLAENAANQSTILSKLDTIEGKIDSVGGSASSPKLTTPTLSLGSWSKADTTYTASMFYSGDGTLSTNIGSISGTTLTITNEDGIFSGVVTATAGTSFTATTLNFSYTEEAGGTPNIRNVVVKRRTPDSDLIEITYDDISEASETPTVYYFEEARWQENPNVFFENNAWVFSSDTSSIPIAVFLPPEGDYAPYLAMVTLPDAN